jgi:hypothetical protein
LARIPRSGRRLDECWRRRRHRSFSSPHCSSCGADRSACERVCTERKVLRSRRQRHRVERGGGRSPSMARRFPGALHSVATTPVCFASTPRRCWSREERYATNASGSPCKRVCVLRSCERVASNLGRTRRRRRWVRSSRDRVASILDCIDCRTDRIAHSPDCIASSPESRARGLDRTKRERRRSACDHDCTQSAADRRRSNRETALGNPGRRRSPGHGVCRSGLCGRT